MSKVKLTKGELKRQRDSLGQFERYLPTLQLKKQQLQITIFRMQKELAEKEAKLETQQDKIYEWAGLFADPFLPEDMDLRQWLLPERVDIETGNIAGAVIPVFVKAYFEKPDYDLYTTPLWVDKAVREISAFMSLLAEIEIIRHQIAIVRKELRVTTQRVNLFEKVKIPEAKDNIRVIRIYLGDQQANAVGISKAAKNRLEKRAF